MTDSSKPGLHLYEKVIKTVKSWVEEQTYSPGDRLPSVRQMSQRLDVSIATVVEAYQRLEVEGMIESRPRSGFYVSASASIVVPEPTIHPLPILSGKVTTSKLTIMIAQLADNPSITPLGAATLSSSFFPLNELRKITAKVARTCDEMGYFYDFIPGNATLQSALSKRSSQWGCSLNPNDFVITNGAMEAIHIAIRAIAKPGDIIAVESPTFYPILKTLENLGMYALEMPSHPRTGIDINEFENTLKKIPIKACFMVSNANNPMGYIMPDENKAQLVELLSKNEIPIVEDDIYGDLYFGDKRPKPLKAFDKKGLVIYCSSFSKSICSGYRIGWICPGQFSEKIQHLKYITNVSAPTLSQLCLTECLNTKLIDRHLMALRPQLSRQVSIFSNAIARYFPKDIKMSQPQGGFLVWVEFAEGFDSMKLYNRALQHGISLAPGNIFSTSDLYNHCVRINCGHPWSQETDHALKKIGELAHKINNEKLLK